MSSIHPTVKIHQTAIIENGVLLGEGCAVWDNVHIRENTSLGRCCIIGEKTYIAYRVQIGNHVKINAFVYICTGVTIDDGVMIAAGTTFTNDCFPRASDPDSGELLTSAPTEATLQTHVCKGVTIGARSTIGPGITLGEYSMIGMGAVVTRDVAPHLLVYGNPAKERGYVCICGQPLSAEFGCSKCNRQYLFMNNQLCLKT